MSTPTFFHANLVLDDTQVSLAASEIAHARNSRRLKAGQEIRLLNGSGLLAEGKIDQIGRDLLTASIDKIREMPQVSQKLIIATAVPKGDRQRTMIDMLTQLAASEIIALECDYSATKVKDKLLHKWQRIAIEACKQSQNPWLPRIEKHLSVPALLQCLRKQSNIMAFYTDGEGEQMSEAVMRVVPNVEVCILVGPEGGFSPSEINLFEQAGVFSLRLAVNILRTETAAITAVAQFRNICSTA